MIKLISFMCFKEILLLVKFFQKWKMDQELLLSEEKEINIGHLNRV